MDRLMCSRCGETLRYEGKLLKCPYCGATYEKEKAEESAVRLEEALGKAKIEMIANRKRHLWDVTHEKYPSKEKVVEATNAVLTVSAEDFLARVYLHSHDRDPLKLNAVLAESKVSPSEAEEVYRWLLPSLSARTVGPLHDFVDRHFSGKVRFEKVTAIESEAAKISQGIYEPGLPRDVFLCYSSHDMGKVVGLLDLLEQNGFACFAAFRNLRHGKGAQEDYLAAIQTAMRSCEVLVFISSEASRSMDCDALKVELPYLIQELPDKPRVEYVLDDYGELPYMVKRILKKAFPSQEYCHDEEDLMDRIHNALGGLSVENRAAPKEDKAPKKEEKKGGRASKSVPKGPSLDEEASRAKAEKEAREKIEADEERKRKAAEIRVDGNALFYGRYPQSKVIDSALIKTLKGLKPSSNGYIAYEGEEYAKVGREFFLVQAIKWRILEIKGEDALVVSETSLDAFPYDNKANNYKDSRIRAYLNGEFLLSAFASGTDPILNTEVDNSLPTTDTSKKLFGGMDNRFVCGPTEDKVMLLSYKDYQDSDRGFVNNPSRVCRASDYASAKGVYCKSNANCSYWTRSPYSKRSKESWSVQIDGSIAPSPVASTRLGLRPAIYVHLGKEASKAKLPSIPSVQQSFAPPTNKPYFEGGYLYYGRYPQTKVKDEALIEKLKKAGLGKNGYLSLDGMDYALYLDSYYLVQPIRWRILQRKGKEALLLSEMILDSTCYDENDEVYSRSKLHDFLCDDFFRAAFDKDSKSVLTTTNGNVFALDRTDCQDASYGLSTDASRRSHPTDYALAKGAGKNQSTGCGKYWTSSAYSEYSIILGKTLCTAYFVAANGSIDHADVDADSIGIRPAIRVKLPKEN